ncbi:MAG TPA: hypothetical protein VG253_11110, partial [Streptosporangiaceae bacterium]|nr:hypothetical protein [Streptosporangiaceae bacterium]
SSRCTPADVHAAVTTRGGGPLLASRQASSSGSYDLTVGLEMKFSISRPAVRPTHTGGRRPRRERANAAIEDERAYGHVELEQERRIARVRKQLAQSWARARHGAAAGFHLSCTAEVPAASHVHQEAAVPPRGRKRRREGAGMAKEKDPAEIIGTIAQSIRVSQRGAR